MDLETEITTVTWLMGRGLSVACGLTWNVPPEWYGLGREDKIEQIKVSLRGEMDGQHINTQPIRALLATLSRFTTRGWRHEFVTTNWDYLLQREIFRLGLEVLPSWLTTSAVFHLNGTVELLPSNDHRSPFLLEEDNVCHRHWTVEAEIAYSRVIWRRVFVVVGMSFECETDRFLLSALQRVEDDLPIGESQWLILNPDREILEQSSRRIREALPRARVEPLEERFESWVQRGMPQLQAVGAIAF